MSPHTGQTSSNSESHSDELQSAVLAQQNKFVIREVLPFQIKHYQHQVELNLLLNTAKQLKNQFFAVEQKPLLSLPDKSSQVSFNYFSFISN